MDLQKYFERIEYTGSTLPTLQTLTDLHIAHTFKIPFENLSPFYHQEVSLNTDKLFDKFVTRKRGGYCFEMNGFFSTVLKQMGFKVLDLLARGAMKGTFAAKMHSVLAVEIDGEQYLCDVGYGNDGIAAPLRLTEEGEQKQFTNTYRFSTVPRYGWVLERKVGDRFMQMFAFTLDNCLPTEFEIANHYTATYPQSFFRMMRFCTKPTETGRITLTDMHYKIVDGDNVSERKTTGEDEFAALMMEHFGLDLEAIKAEPKI